MHNSLYTMNRFIDLSFSKIGVELFATQKHRIISYGTLSISPNIAMNENHYHCVQTFTFNYLQGNASTHCKSVVHFVEKPYLLALRDLQNI